MVCVFGRARGEKAVGQEVRSGRARGEKRRARGEKRYGKKEKERERDVQSTVKEFDEDAARGLQTFDTSEKALVYRAKQVQELHMGHLPHFVYPSEKSKHVQ